MLTIKSPPINRFATRPIKIRKISPLTHEPGNNPMEYTALVSKPLLTSTKSLKVGYRLRRNVSIQSELDTTERFAVGRDVKKDGVSYFCGGWFGSKEIGEKVHAEGGRRFEYSSFSTGNDGGLKSRLGG